jgi:hypothetical protein
MQNQESELLKEQQYQKDVKKIESKDAKKNWVRTSPYLFYLSLACFVLLTWGGCYKLYTKRFAKPNVTVQGSSQYTPVYK